LTELLTALPAALPWLVLLLVFVGMLALCWKLASGQHDLATLLAQALANVHPPELNPEVIGHTVATALAPNPASLPAPFPVKVQVAPPPAPKPTGAFAGAPEWFQWAVHEIGFHETGNNQGTQRYIVMAHCGALGDAWCAIFENAAFEVNGITGTRSPSSQSFRTNPNFVQLSGPALGAVAVFWRGAKTSGLGHVGFYRGEDANSVWTLGGNENDMVQIEALAKDSATFGLIGYWWPKSVPLPTTGAVMMPTGSPTSIQTAPTGVSASTPATGSDQPGLQTNIVATYFGGQQSAYGPPIDDNSPGVALPFHFIGTRPRVRVTGKKNGVSIDCDIVDVGPWNIDDPYWETGARPQAESGADLGQVSRGVPRRTNKAGIDLTLAAAQACGIDGKGLCDWQFIQNPASPKVT
jgi:uncharacterized protein (TIGR02594 family)